jgi:hypothetical protein
VFSISDRGLPYAAARPSMVAPRVRRAVRLRAVVVFAGLTMQITLTRRWIGLPTLQVTSTAHPIPALDRSHGRRQLSDVRRVPTADASQPQGRRCAPDLAFAARAPPGDHHGPRGSGWGCLAGLRSRSTDRIASGRPPVAVGPRRLLSLTATRRARSALPGRRSFRGTAVFAAARQVSQRADRLGGTCGRQAELLTVRQQLSGGRCSPSVLERQGSVRCRTTQSGDGVGLVLSDQDREPLVHRGDRIGVDRHAAAVGDRDARHDEAERR